MQKLTRISWNKAYSVHHENIDAQHKKLFDITNRLMDVYEDESGNLIQIIKELVDYASIHFHAESLVMLDARYPGFSQHNKEHEDFIEKIQEFIKKFREQDQDLSYQMLSYLSKWLLEHTTKSDIKWADYAVATRMKRSSSTVLHS